MKACVIDIPRKVSRPKIRTKFQPEPVYTNVDEGHFVWPDLGHAVLREASWEPGLRKNKISFCERSDSVLLDKVQFGDEVSVSVKTHIKSLIRDFWDVFAQEGLKSPMLGYEFCIDTGSHTPYCCRKPAYGTHESKIIMKHIMKLLDMGWITHCETGGWCSPIVLAPKPRQEHVVDISDFV